MSKKTNKQVKYLQVTVVLRKKKTTTTRSKKKVKGRGTQFRLNVQKKISLWRSHLSHKLGKGKKLSPKGVEGRAGQAAGKAHVTSLRWRKVWAVKESVKKWGWSNVMRGRGLQSDVAHK